jgi:hypothetical protein
MNKVQLKLIFALLFVLAGAFSTKGQQGKAYPGIEKVTLFTDRALYITGEEMLFSAYITSESQPELSQILYAEIILPDGKYVSGGKYPIVNHAANGCLIIPKDIITGVYYLRVYTKYMRNIGPQSYSYAAIKIVNSMRDEVLSGKDTAKIVNTAEYSEKTVDAFVISLAKNEFLPRETVKVLLKTNGISRGDIQGLSISVVPEASASENLLKLPGHNQRVSLLNFYPETRGVSITGKLKDNTNGKAVSGARVNLSIIGKGRDFMAMQTDSAGRYFFSLPAYTGSRDLFLSAEDATGLHPKIMVDNDFCDLPVHLPSPIFKLTAEEQAAVYKMSLNTRLAKVFATDTIPCSNTADRPDVAFYGKPSATLVIDKYIQLPTLEDYFYELPSFVKVRKRDGGKYLKVIGPQAEMTFFDPLLLVDWVAISDPARILAVPPQNIDRIELVYDPYVKGDITYGGIVSFISKKGDFAGIDLPTSGIFLNYLFLSDKSICTINEPANKNIPDTHNTLYWEPNYLLSQENSTPISFTTPDTPGHYTIVLKGILRSGETFIQTKDFEVAVK